jgi:hypothetical protein
MSRLRTSAFFLIALCAIGCSSKEDNGDSSGDVDESEGDSDNDKAPGKRDGGKTDGKVTSQIPDAGPRRDTGPIGQVGGDDITPWARDDTGESGLSAGDIDKLKEGGEDCDSGSVLYPYDGVMWPVGLAPPSIMFADGVDGAYLKLKYAGNEEVWYETAAGPTNPGEMAIAPDAWLEILRRTNEQALAADIGILRGGKVQTCHFKWRVAEGALVGQIFYNTYNLPGLGGQGAVMRLPLGQAESEMYLKYPDNAFPPPALAGPCLSCHSVSTNGKKLAASTHNYNPLSQTFKSEAFDVTEEVQPAATAELPESTFAAFTPKGDKMLAMGNPQCTKGSNAFPRAPNNFMLVPGPSVAQMHDTATGDVIPANGLDPDHYMWMPQFSPDGTKVVFNHAKPDPEGNGTDRRELAVMDFDNETNTFSNLKVISTAQGPEPSVNYAPLPTLSFPGINTPEDCQGQPNTPSDVGAIPLGSCTGPCYPGWPFFTPDGEAVVYVLGSEPDFAAAFPGRDNSSLSELWYVDIASGNRVKLENAGSGPKDTDGVQNYYPTVLPVSVGGYYWLFWSSMRDWGHRDTNPAPDQVLSNWFGGGAVLTATRKRIWVSALKPPRVSEGFQDDVQDFSTKPFYLEGQSNSGNIRAFATLNPCREENADCTSGIDCCTGFCEIPEGATTGKCVPPNRCAKRQERCEDDSNCCPQPEGVQPLVCLGGYCDKAIQ